MTRPDDMARTEVARSRRRGANEKTMIQSIGRLRNIAEAANARGDLELLRYAEKMIERMGRLLARAAEIEGRAP